MVVDWIGGNDFFEFCNRLKEFCELLETPDDIDRMPNVGSTSYLARCLTYDRIWQEYGHDPDFKKCIWPGVKDPTNKIGVIAHSHETYLKFPLLFENLI